MVDSNHTTRAFRVTGTVQGVGFRPFVARLADRFALDGWVRNDNRGVTFCVGGSDSATDAFVRGVRTEAPPAAIVQSVEELFGAADGVPEEKGFRIVPSDGASTPVTAVSADLALCEDCRRELLDPADRRFRYPFINCTHCGPRYSIVRELPYDRPHTTMAGFTMCPHCASEYLDPLNRRYHAQPNACPICGPRLTLLDAAGNERATADFALRATVDALREGRVAAVKGLGGFHLCVDAMNADAVIELRHRKHREEKPFAVLFPSLEALKKVAFVSSGERSELCSPAAPIVLVRRRPGCDLPDELAPGNPWIGAMLPYTPLHVLMLHDFGSPLVATSANLSEEPLCTDNEEALERLRGIADCFLVHDRPIARGIDDSVVRFARSGRIILRRARGFAPAPLPMPRGESDMAPALCVGGHLKNTVAVTIADQAVLSPHLGDLENTLTQSSFERTIDLLTSLYGGRECRVVCDAHPEYASTMWAEKRGLPLTRVQHHVAHVLACLLEHPDVTGRILGVSWDGTGYGDDGAIWGGEFYRIEREHKRVERIAALRPFFLPGGEAAVRDTRRSLLGMLFAAETPLDIWMETALELGFEAGEAHLIHQALSRGLNCPVTSSAGRLFDAVAALLGLCHRNAFEAQGGMSVEAAATRFEDGGCNPLPLPVEVDRSEFPARIDWAPTLWALRDSNALVGEKAYAFHQWCAESIHRVAQFADCRAVALTGGCFQNALLTDLVSEELKSSGFEVLLHRHLSPNDNSIAAGQALFARDVW